VSVSRTRFTSPRGLAPELQAPSLTRDVLHVISGVVPPPAGAEPQRVTARTRAFRVTTMRVGEAAMPSNLRRAEAPPPRRDKRC
jgi:hypothetical protein